MTLAKTTGSPDGAPRGKGEITGRHVLIGAIAAFAVVFTVNMIMVFAATGSFPGLVDHKNPWVASQNFDARAEARARLGWRSTLGYSDGWVAAEILNADGAVANARAVQVEIVRPTSAGEDQTVPLVLNPATNRFEGAIELSSGAWRLVLQATAADGAPFRAETRIFVK